MAYALFFIPLIYAGLLHILRLPIYEAECAAKKKLGFTKSLYNLSIYLNPHSLHFQSKKLNLFLSLSFFFTYQYYQMTATDLIKPSSGISNAINIILTFLERVSDENIWKSFLGERLVNLGQKYFGNDFVTLSLAFYLAPILKTHWQNLVALIFKKVTNKNTASVRIFNNSLLYDDISKYVFENGPSKGNMTEGVLDYHNGGVGNYVSTEYYDDEFFDGYERDELVMQKKKEDEDNFSTEVAVKLQPPSSFTEIIEYKGHKITVEFIEGTTETIEHLLISMNSPDTKMLHVIIEEWSTRTKKEEVNRYIYRADGTCWNYQRNLSERSFESVHLRDGQKELLTRDMKTFRKKADWYHKRGISHRRGYLLYGPPGTGKTSTIQAVATALDMNVAFVSLSSVASNEILSQLISNLPSDCIMVMEDIDHLFNPIKTKDSESGHSSLTISGLLNVLDGMQSNEGSMIFMTCNTIEKIEPALLRPGRIDLKIKLDYAAPEQIRGTFWRFMDLDDKTSLPLEPEERAKVEKLADRFVDMIPAYTITTAEMQGFFVDMLLEANANQWEREDVYERMFTRIPEFLEKVEFDREQAKKHKLDYKKEEKSESEEE